MRILSTLFTGTTQNATQAANTIADDLLSMLPVKIAARTALLHIIKTAAMSGGGVVIIPLELLGALGITLGSEVILPVVASCFFFSLVTKNK